MNPLTEREFVDMVTTSRKVTDGPMGLGTRFTETMKVMAMKVDTICEVTVFEPPHRMAMVVDGKLGRYEGGFTFARSSAGTRLSVEAQIAPKGPPWADVL